MKKLLVMLLSIVTLVTLISFDSYAKPNKYDEDEYIKVYRIYSVSVDGKHYGYDYVCDVLPREIGEYVIAWNKEYDAMSNGGVDKETIDEFQMRKYTDKIIELGNKYPEWIDLDDLGL